MFGPDDAWWCNGKEILHVEGDGVIDLRLTRAVIRDLRAGLRQDPRVTLRKSTSDWVEVRIASSDDVAFVLDLVERAAAAHRSGPGETPKAPPVGRELERRRRFH